MRWIAVAVFVALAAFGAWLVAAAVAPLDQGIDARVFADARRDAEPASRFIAAAADAPALRPNVVVILADDLGWGDLGVQGSPSIETPNLDRLAAEGLRFTNFYASAPVCSPSRAGLLTGRYPLRSGIVFPVPAANDTFLGHLLRHGAIAFAKLGAVDVAGGVNAAHGLPHSEITLAEALRVAGYRTMAIGKWHLGDFSADPQQHPSQHGFERFAGFPLSNDEWPVGFWRDDVREVADIALDQERYTALFTEEAVRFIETPSSAPFFLYLAHKDPHQPFLPGARFAGRSEAGPYGDAVAELDWSVGEVIAALRRTGAAERTLVLFTSDNGAWFEGSTGGLRGRKGQSYEGGFRVPMIAWWPGRVAAGGVTDVPAMNIDFFPTAVALAGITPPSDRVLDGTDLTPLLTGGAASLPERPLFFLHQYDVEAVRLGRFKYFRSHSHYTWPAPLDKLDTAGGRLAAGGDYQPPGSTRSVPRRGAWPQLYDVARDPGEAYDVAKRHPEEARRAAEKLDAFRRDLYANPRGWR